MFHYWAKKDLFSAFLRPPDLIEVKFKMQILSPKTSKSDSVKEGYIQISAF